MAWYAKTTGAYARDSSEAIDNATEIYGVLYNRGWTVNAVCGVLGNMGAESGYNPWRWQSDNVQPSTASPWTDIGYGLVQFTPGGKYINYASSYAGYGPNFSDRSGLATDGQAQMLFIDENADYYATSAYPLTYAQFKVSTDSPADLASAWLYNYERPADPAATESARRENGNYWYTVLTGVTPPTPGGGTRPKLKLYMMLRSPALRGR